MDNKKYFIYARISSDDYDKSIDNQLDICWELALKMGIPEENLIKCDEKVSGAKTKKREKFDDMIETILKDLEESKKDPKKRKYGGIIFFKIDRLARNYEDFNTINKLFDEGYKFISATETIENTPTGKLLFRMLASFAIYESEKLGNRITIAYIHNLLKNEFRKMGGSQTIYGYKVNKNTNKIEIVEEQSKIIRRIFDLSLQGYKHKQIADIIEKEFKGKLGKYLIDNEIKVDQERFIRNILHNDDNAIKYNGYIERSIGIKDELVVNYLKVIKDKDYQDFTIEGDNEVGGEITFVFYCPDLQIVNDIVYNEVNQHNSTRKKERREKKIFNGLFTGFIFVKKDGIEYKSYPDVKKDKHFNYRSKIDGQFLGKSELKIENKIIQSEILTKLNNLKEYKGEIYKYLTEFLKQNNADKLKSLNMLKIIYEREVDYSMNYMTSKNDPKDIEYYTRQSKKYNQKLSEINEEIFEIHENKIKIIEDYMNLFQIKNIQKENILVRRLFYKTFVEKITFDEDLKITIYFRQFIHSLLKIPRPFIID